MNILSKTHFRGRGTKFLYQLEPIMNIPRRSTSDQPVLIPLELEDLLRTPWIRAHLYSVGFHFLHFETYRKFHHLLFVGGAGAIKTIAFDIASFIKREMKSEQSQLGKELLDLVYLSSNYNLSIHLNMGTEDSSNLIATRHKFTLSKWFFITFGYFASYSPSIDTDLFIDQVINIYLNAKNSDIKRSNENIKVKTDDNQVLSLLVSYFDTVNINYCKLYDLRDDKYIILNDSINEKIELPPLPRIHNRHRLVKALMHCESYRALLKPNHNFAKNLLDLGFDLNPRNHSILKYQLSFYDGLGDFFLAREASNLLYNLHEQGVASNMRCNLYHVIKTILSTNTLLSKIAVAYNLHLALDDSVMHDTIVSEYIPNFYHDKEIKHDRDVREFEEEFLADYFEAYVGALYLEQPDVATAFVREIYNNLVTTITRVVPPDVSYLMWTTNIVGRSLVGR